MMSTNTDAYQPVIHPDPVMRKKLQEYLRSMVRRTLEILLEPEFARLNLRIQTRGLAAEGDFDLMQKFGNRILFGMSVPTLNNALARIYEPKAPAPTRPEIPGMKKSPPGRLELLKKAMDMGIPGYVAMAPTFPECDEADLRKTLTAFSKLPLHTIFHEAINARAENVDRILEEAKRQEKTTAAEVIRHPATQIPYAIEQMKLVEKIATELGIGDKLHLWPDAELLAQKVVDAQPDPDAFRTWLRRWHGRISEWPGYDGPRDYDPYQAKQTTQDPTDDLTATEKKTLAKAVTAVKGLSRSEYKAGNALRLIIDRRLHRPASFEDFCQARFGFSRQHGYHLIDFAVLTDNVSTTVDKNRLPTHERQARGIMKAFRDSPEQQQAAWLRACEMAGGVPGSDVVMAAVDELVKKDEPADPKPAAPPARNPKAARVFKIVDALENAIGTGVDHVGIQRLVDQLKGELEAIFGKAA
jgi:DNA repair photolyase